MIMKMAGFFPTKAPKKLVTDDRRLPNTKLRQLYLSVREILLVLKRSASFFELYRSEDGSFREFYLQ